MPSPTIFISYRHSDSKDITGRIYDRLVDAFGENSVFRDFYDIKPGQDFRGRIRVEVARCDTMLVIIGPSWLNVTERNNSDLRRLDNPQDWHRLEIETALQRDDVRVIPLLVKGADIPAPDDLPLPIRELAFKNAAIVRDDPDFRFDMDRLIAVLRDSVGTAFLPSAAPEPPARTGMSDTVKVAIIAGIFTVIAALIAIVPNLLPKTAETPTTQAVIAPSNTPPPTDAPTITPLPPTPTPSITPLPPTSTNTPLPPTPTPTNSPIPPTPASTSGLTVLSNFQAPGTNSMGIACKGNSLLIVNNSTDLFEVDFSGKILGIFNAPEPSPTGLGGDGTRFWVSTTNRSLVHEFQISGSQLIAGAAFESPGVITASSNDMAWDGSNLWYADHFEIHRLDSSGNPAGTSLFFGQEVTGLDWDGANLWIAQTLATASPTISMLDGQGNVLSSFASPSPEISGLAWCAGNLWALGGDYSVGSPNQVYQLAVAGWAINTTVPPTPIVVMATPTVPPAATIAAVKSYPCDATVVARGSEATTINSQFYSQPRTTSIQLSYVLKVGQKLVVKQSRETDGLKWYEIVETNGLAIGWNTSQFVNQYFSLSINCPS